MTALRRSTMLMLRLPPRVCAQVLDELCAVVEEEGMLCTSPLADSSLPLRYKTPPFCHPDGIRCQHEDFNAHVRLVEALTPHFHVWMVRHPPTHARNTHTRMPHASSSARAIYTYTYT